MIQQRRLSCGTTIIMERIPHIQSVALGIWVRAGAIDERADIAGVSHFIEHMMFKGTEKRTARQLAEDVDKFGGQINAFTGKEATCYYIKTLSSNIEKATEILLDMLLYSKMDELEMDKERGVIKEEIKMTQDTPDDDAHETIVELVFNGHPLQNSILGTPETLDKINSKVIKDYIRQEYTRDNLVIAVAGNFDEDKACQLFEGHLQLLDAEKKPKASYVNQQSRLFKTKTKDIEQSHVCLATRGVSLEDNQYYAFNLLSNIMGGTMSSRLFQKIREEKGLAYTVYSMTSSFSDTGYYNIYAGVAHDKIEQTVEAIKDELNILKRDGITPEELETAKEQMKSAYIFGQENVSGRMFSIGKNMLISRKIHTPEEVLAEFNKVTLEDLAGVTKLICNLDDYSGAAITNKEIDLKAIWEA